jgi:hypothetical protein
MSSKDESAILAAIHHYESEIKNGKSYAKPIAEGLYIALKKTQKYDEIINKLLIK